MIERMREFEVERYLEQVWHVLPTLLAHGLGATEGGICSHMDAIVTAPVNDSVIPEERMHFHLQSKRHIYYVTCYM